MADGELLVERRKYPRWNVPIEITFKVLKGGKPGIISDFFSKKLETKTSNLSGGGALLSTGAEVKPGDKLDINMYLQSTETTVKIIAEVTRVTSGVAAVRFVEIKTESDEILQDIIRQKMRFSMKSNITQEEALNLAQREYFLRMLDEELRHRNI